MKITHARGEIGRHKGFKILALVECQFESGRGTICNGNFKTVKRKLINLNDIFSKNILLKIKISLSLVLIRELV